jgi:hypothetical protein
MGPWSGRPRRQWAERAQENPAFRRDLFLLWHLPWILAGFLTLTARILLLLARLLTAALLLLAWLLTWLLARVLVLLARVLVHLVHRGISVAET